VAEKKSKKILVVMITPDRGLCGGLISNLLKVALDFKAEKEKEGKELSYIVVGKKGASFLKRTNANILAVFPDKSFWKLIDIGAIHKLIIESFLSGEYESVEVIYSNFISPVRQKATARGFLPLTSKNLEKLIETKKFNENLLNSKELIYQIEPTPSVIAESLIPHMLKMGLYFLFLETKASEHSARMIAMENSRKNAKELADDLTLSYNKLRQAQITSQIAEIVGGAAVMEE
jgi:F-type H+-transporting ATPase subunit gamma